MKSINIYIVRVCVFRYISALIKYEKNNKSTYAFY